MATTKASRLAAVNTIIANIGQSPVTTLETGNPLVEMAEQTLEEITRAVLAEGWQHNTERAYPFNPEIDGEIRIPPNVLAIDTPPQDNRQITIREGRAYDRVNHTYLFTGLQHFDVTWLFDFEELPEVFKNYITIRAANVFAGRSVGSQEAVTFGQREEIIARSTLLEYETQQGDYTIFSDANGSTTYNGRAYRPLSTVLRY